MGGAVSSGKDNDELIDNLIGGNYIRSSHIERVFRALDRADYMTPESRNQAYKDLAWRNGPLHLSAPCIYSKVMEGLKLKPGLSFLNVGSGTGYLSTMVGLVIGASGINHGIEVHQTVVDYAVTKNSQFIENSPVLDDFDFCEPKYYRGNGLCIAPLQAQYDRVYCGAGCPEEYFDYFKQLIKIGGILVMPLKECLIQVCREAAEEWSSKELLQVSFASLIVPTKQDSAEHVKLDELCPPRLQALSRSVIRRHMRLSVLTRHPELRGPPPKPRPTDSCPRRICIPIEQDSDVEGLDALHDLDPAGGAHEMNALLGLVLSMGQNRVAGALRFDPLDSPSDSSEDEDEDNDEGGGNDDDGDDNDGGTAQLSDDAPAAGGDRGPSKRSCRGLFTFELQDSTGTPPTDSSPSTSSSSHNDDNNKSEGTKALKMPSEVEILLGKKAGASHSTMEWDEAEKVHSDEETETSTEKKRVKLDSGIGEENSPSSGSQIEKTDGKSDESGVEAGSDSLTDEADDEHVTGRRRRQKRSRCHMSERSSSTDRDTDETSDTETSSYARCKRRAGPQTSDARRVRLSILMKQGVRELPLPYALKKYVNFGRCFQF